MVELKRQGKDKGTALRLCAFALITKAKPLSLPKPDNLRY